MQPVARSQLQREHRPADPAHPPPQPRPPPHPPPPRPSRSVRLAPGASSPASHRRLNFPSAYSPASPIGGTKSPTLINAPSQRTISPRSSKYGRITLIRKFSTVIRHPCRFFANCHTGNPSYTPFR